MSIAPTSQPPNFPNLKPRRLRALDDRAPLDPGAQRSSPAPFPPPQPSSPRRSDSGSLAASSSSTPRRGLCRPSIPCFRPLTRCLARAKSGVSDPEPFQTLPQALYQAFPDLQNRKSHPHLASSLELHPYYGPPHWLSEGLRAALIFLLDLTRIEEEESREVGEMEKMGGRVGRQLLGRRNKTQTFQSKHPPFGRYPAHRAPSPPPSFFPHPRLWLLAGR